MVRVALWMGRLAGAVLPPVVAYHMYHTSYYLYPSSSAYSSSSPTGGLHPIGQGPLEYTLYATDSTTVTSHTFLKDNKHWSLLYFGFAKCAEICPSNVRYMADVSKALLGGGPSSSENISLAVAFVTLDPHRDSLSQLEAFLKQHSAQYLSGLPTRFIGYRGDDASTKAIAQSWKVYFSVPDDATPESEYQMDHSSFVFLVSPKGKFVDFFTKDMPPEQAADKIRLHAAGCYDS